MTTDRDQATRDRLAEALTGDDFVRLLPLSTVRVILDALLPVVADLVREGQAEALEMAADSGVFTAPYRKWLRAQAAALREPRGEGAT